MKYFNKILFVILFWISISAFSYLTTSPQETLSNDASTYYSTAINLAKQQNIFYSFFSTDSSFIDLGYPIFLSILITIFGSQSIILLQFANLFLWLLTCLLIFCSLEVIQPKGRYNLLIFFSSLYLAFFPKLYSENFAALGLAMIIWSIVRLNKNLNTKLSLTFLLLGSIILFSTKSMFLCFIPLLVIFTLVKRNFKATIIVMISLVLLIPRIQASRQGDRAGFNLAIQLAKTNLNYSEILSCVPYYFSYPIGQKLLPNFQGICHQNNPDVSMPNYSKNPYTIATKYQQLHYRLFDYLSLFLQNPIKTLLIFISSLFNFILFEGIYPNTLANLPYLISIPIWLITKVFFSVFIWIRFFKNFRYPLIIFSFLTFIATVIFFPVEQRYIYPLIPFIYFTASLESKTFSKRLI